MLHDVNFRIQNNLTIHNPHEPRTAQPLAGLSHEEFPDYNPVPLAVRSGPLAIHGRVSAVLSVRRWCFSGAPHQARCARLAEKPGASWRRLWVVVRAQVLGAIAGAPLAAWPVCRLGRSLISQVIVAYPLSDCQRASDRFTPLPIYSRVTLAAYGQGELIPSGRKIPWHTTI